jgi:transcriptional regulator with XRE-family HTH domain
MNTKDNKMTVNGFGIACRQYRTQKQINMQQMAMDLGISQGHISKIERSTDSPPFDWVEKCIRYFNLNPQQEYELWITAFSTGGIITFQPSDTFFFNKKEIASLLAIAITQTRNHDIYGDERNKFQILINTMNSILGVK